MRGRRLAVRALIAVALCVIVIGCQGTPTITQECPLALIEGTLVAENGELRIQTGSVDAEVRWPSGVHVGFADGKLALYGFFGQVIAREGDFVRMGGGSGADNTFQGCGEIQVGRVES